MRTIGFEFVFLNLKLIIIILTIFVAFNYLFGEGLYIDFHDLVASVFILIGVNLGSKKFISNKLKKFKAKWPHS